MQIVSIWTRSHLGQLKRLNRWAREERGEFQEVPSAIDLERDTPPLTGYLALAPSGQAIGYIVFYQDKDKYEGIPILQQLFVKKSQRRKGIATLLIQTVLDNHALVPDSKGHRFILGDPNIASIKVFKKLGFAEIIAERTRLIRCAMFGKVIVS